MRVCDEDVERLDGKLRAELRASYERIIAELTLLALRLCWTEPPNELWTESMVREFKEPYRRRLNEVVPRAVLKDLTCELGFTEYRPRPQEDPQG